MIRRPDKTTSLGIALALGAALLALGAAPAAAAPELGISLSRDAASVSHSDERVDYAVSVKNTATAPVGSPEVGDTLSCVNRIMGSSGSWILPETTHYSFQFRWYRNGTPVTAWQSGIEAGEGQRVNTYVVQAADAGTAIQCLVKGTNGVGSGSAVVASQPTTVIAPAPGVAPPIAVAVAVARRPGVSGSAKNAGEKLKCTAPTTWEGTPSWSFEWLRDGEPASGSVSSTATESEYTLTTADVEAPAAPAAFQCLAKATNTGGSVLVESITVVTEAPAPAFVPGGDSAAPRLNAGYVPEVERATNTIASPLTVEVELPGGSETRVYEAGGMGWSCNKVLASGLQHAKALCTITSLVKPGESLPALSVATALGADAPDLAVARAVAFGGGAAETASDENVFAFDPLLPFALTSFAAAVKECDGSDYTVAGGHPCTAEGDVALTRKRVLDPTAAGHTLEYAPIEQIKQNVTDLPRGFVGNPTAVPVLCQGRTEEIVKGTCPEASRIGGVRAVTSTAITVSPIYAIVPEYGTPFQLAFNIPAENVFTFSAHLRPQDGYAASLELAPGFEANVYEAEVTLCDLGVKAGSGFPGCKEPGDPTANPQPLISNPTRCEGQPVTRTRFNSWEHPDHWIESSFAAAAITECAQVPFEPKIDPQPTSHAADSPSGLDVELSMPTTGLESPTGISQAQMKKSRIVFPEGMSIDASAAHGLESCSASEVKLGTNDPVSCPESAKIGTIEIETPLLRETLVGNIYVAKQGEVNGSLIGIYLVFESKQDGIVVKVPGTVEPDEKTGRLVAVVDELPEAPFSTARLHFPSGSRAALLTPPMCGPQTIKAELFPWTGAAPVVSESSFDVTTGPNGAPCPTGALEPKLTAGSTDPTAGKTSPFVLRLTREDGSQRFSGLAVHTPPGLTAYLKGVPYCPDATLASISSAPGSGQSQIDSPSCPAASQIGTVTAGAGAGPDPFYVDSGKAYLAGPYKGAPISIAAVVPAVAGPFDLGSVVIRNAVYVDPETARIDVVSDPIPTIIHGIKPDVRDLRVAIDRPDFTLNPTNCEPLSVGATVTGESGASASLSNRFQVAGCGNLPFEPNLKLQVLGGTGRNAKPKFRAELTAKPGEANIATAQVNLPHSEFLEQNHIKTVCTRVQFAEGDGNGSACPAGSIYGHVTAWSPLLEKPLEGPVFLRSNGGERKLPDLVAALDGQVDIALWGKVDSGPNHGIRNTFEVVPDAPVSKFVLEMNGGKKGLLVNSENLCSKKAKRQAIVRFTGQNGKVHAFKPLLQNQCGKKNKRKKNAGHGRANPRLAALLRQDGPTGL